jgi:hypothetical protein
MFRQNKAISDMDTKLNFRIDLIIGAAFALALVSGLAAQPRHGAIEFHTFVGLGLSLGIMIHLSLHRKWMAAASRSSEKSGRMKWSLWLNRLLVLSWLWALLSGLYGHLNPHGDTPTHVLAAASMTLILVVHFVRHWKWVTVTTKRYWG